MTNYKEITLGNDAINYVMKHLSYGHAISKTVLNKLDIQNGQIIVGLPEYANWEKVNDLEHGGILPAVDRSKWRTISGENGKTYTMELIPRFFPFIVDNIKSFLMKSSTNLCILENANASPTDWALKNIQSIIWTFQSEVYHILGKGEQSQSEIEKTIKESESLWTWIGFLTSFPGIDSYPIVKKEISMDIIMILAGNVEKILVGAYDGEGFLVWNRIMPNFKE